MLPPARAIADDRGLFQASKYMWYFPHFFLTEKVIPANNPLAYPWIEHNLEAAVMPDGQLMLGVLSGFLSQNLTPWSCRGESVYRYGRPSFSFLERKGRSAEASMNGHFPGQICTV